jgi:uncharacterized membrane protein
MIEQAADAPDRDVGEEARLIRLPSVRHLAGKAGSHLIEAVIVPAVTFYAVLRLIDLRWALLAALLWSYVVIGVRMTRRARVPGLLIVSAVLMTARTGIAFAANSSFVYFLQPSLANFGIAVLFLASLVPGRPLTRRLADDFCMLPGSLDRRPRCAQFFTRLTLLWAFVCAANGAAALLLLLHASLGSFLALRPVVSYSLIVAGIALSFAWFRRTLRAEGLVIVFGHRSPMPSPARGPERPKSW